MRESNPRFPKEPQSHCRKGVRACCGAAYAFEMIAENSGEVLARRPPGRRTEAGVTWSRSNPILTAAKGNRGENRRENKRSRVSTRRSPALPLSYRPAKVERAGIEPATRRWAIEVTLISLPRNAVGAGDAPETGLRRKLNGGPHAGLLQRARRELNPLHRPVGLALYH